MSCQWDEWVKDNDRCFVAEIRSGKMRGENKIDYQEKERKKVPYFSKADEKRMDESRVRLRFVKRVWGLSVGNDAGSSGYVCMYVCMYVCRFVCRYV